MRKLTFEKKKTFVALTFWHTSWPAFQERTDCKDKQYISPLDLTGLLRKKNRNVMTSRRTECVGEHIGKFNGWPQHSNPYKNV